MSLPHDGHVIIAFRPTTFDEQADRWNVERVCSCGDKEPHEFFGSEKAPQEMSE